MEQNISDPLIASMQMQRELLKAQCVVGGEAQVEDIVLRVLLSMAILLLIWYVRNHSIFDALAPFALKKRFGIYELAKAYKGRLEICYGCIEDSILWYAKYRGSLKLLPYIAKRENFLEQLKELDLLWEDLAKVDLSLMDGMELTEELRILLLKYKHIKGSSNSWRMKKVVLFLFTSGIKALQEEMHDLMRDGEWQKIEKSLRRYAIFECSEICNQSQA